MGRIVTQDDMAALAGGAGGGLLIGPRPPREARAGVASFAPVQQQPPPAVSPPLNLPPSLPVDAQPPSLPEPEPSPAPPAPAVAPADAGGPAPFEGMMPEEIALKLIEGRPVENKNNRWLGALLTALAAVGQEFQRNPASDWQGVARGLGAGAAGFGVGMARPSTDEHLKKEYDIARQREKVDHTFKIAERGARVRQTDALTRKYEAWDDIERGKVEAQQLTRARSHALANLRLLKGQKLDPNNAQHFELLKQLAGTGTYVDVEAWNDSAYNTIPVEIVDPNNPTQKRRALLNKVTGELTDVGQSNYVQPVGKSGMTPFQEGSLALGGERLEVSREQLGLARERLALSQADYERRLTEGMNAHAVRTFKVKTEGLRGQLNQLREQINGYKTRAARKEIMPADATRIIEGLELQAADIDAQLQGARDEALGALRAPARGVGSAGRVSRRNFDRVRAQNPSLRGKSDAEVESILRAQGYEVY